MATETHYWSGKVNWAKVYKTDKFGNYVIDFYPDDPEVIKDAGLSLEPKVTEDGTYYRLRRKPEAMIRDELVKWGAPKVFRNTGEVDAQGIPVVEPFTKLIGNGSRVTVKVVVFDVPRGRGHRLESLRVDEHVPYEPSEQPEKPATAEYPF